MKYAISYVSTAHIDLSEQGVQDLMNEAEKFNDHEKITGILLYNQRNFFQLIEGDKKTIQDLYEKIAQDARHQDIIKFLESSVCRTPFDGYMTDFITDSNKHEKSRLVKYLRYIEVLEPESQRSIKRVIELMMV